MKPEILFCLVALVVGMPASLATAATHADFPLLINTHGLHVYGPPQHPNAPCLRGALRMNPASHATARKAVSLAMPPFEHRLDLNGRNPAVRIATSATSGYSAAAGGCGRQLWQRSLVAFVRLPRIHGASLSQHTFAVARTKAGWFLWAMIH
jgi:hypothetical protein